MQILKAGIEILVVTSRVEFESLDIIGVVVFI
jgi:hypothetical protein